MTRTESCRSCRPRRSGSARATSGSPGCLGVPGRPGVHSTPDDLRMTADDGENSHSGPTESVGVLRECVLHRYAQYCNRVRGRLLILYLKQSVNIQDLDSGGRGRRFTKSRSGCRNYRDRGGYQPASRNSMPCPSSASTRERIVAGVFCASGGGSPCGSASQFA